MHSIGVRELKAQASKILRRVREGGETIEVTYRGRVVARLVPVDRSQSAPAELDAVWADLDRLAAEVGAHWSGEGTAVDAVREGRREL